MIIRGEGLEQQKMEKPRGGVGTAIRMAYEKAAGITGEITNFAMMQLEPGSSIGYHKHTGDMEYYLILDGEGKFNDNGEESRVSAGDLTVTTDGQSHSLENDTINPLTFLALIVKH